MYLTFAYPLPEPRTRFPIDLGRSGCRVSTGSGPWIMEVNTLRTRYLEWRAAVCAREGNHRIGAGSYGS